MDLEIEPTQSEIEYVARTMNAIYADPIARESGYICAKMLKRAFRAAGRKSETENPD